MIIYELQCGKNHRFEGWFKDRGAFEKQRRDNQIVCPVCGGTDMSLAPSPVAIGRKEDRSVSQKISDGRESLKAFHKLQKYFNNNFDDVGDRFTEIALKIHHGEEKGRNIKGVATGSEEEILRDEGVQFIKINLPKFDG